MKIAFLIRDLNYGGAQRQLVTLVKALPTDIFAIAVLYFYADGPLIKELEYTNIKLICLDKKGRWDTLNFLRNLYQNLQKIKPDVLHAYLGEANLISLFLKPLFPKTKIILSIRGSEENLLETYGKISLWMFRLESWMSFLADLIIANSKAGKKYHVSQGFPAPKTIVIPNGIDIKKFASNLEERNRLRAEWQINQDEILIGLIGRLSPMKDHPNFLQAAALVSQKGDDIKFVCVGTGSEDYAHKLLELTAELALTEKVIWAGSRSDMLAVHNALDIAVLTSVNGEGFPNVIGEAMACGKPCIATDVGDSAWIVGELGTIVPPQNSEALAEAICATIETLKNHQFEPEKIRQRIVDNFSVESLVNNTQIAILNEVKSHLSLVSPSRRGN
ncbi:group 1 glycosyl transferase [Merismopedia glauca CCAP 1448/3]|uniref:Group 1 glycosyl transferase n=1 Tax=Merismopedia glauca CCAP 1448/3 TaxID=1296344 RepID=A0A2T1C0S7_9CYAN|nr:group 1 glycosyl transferase [Merismopedia glauca CCAP 1448/3]